MKSATVALLKNEQNVRRAERDSDTNEQNVRRPERKRDYAPRKIEQSRRSSRNYFHKV